MTPEDHARAAEDLLKAEETGQQIGLLTKRYPEMGLDDAYAVQKAIYAAKLVQGRRVVGWKIGLTSKAMQYALKPCPRAASSSQGSKQRSPSS